MKNIVQILKKMIKRMVSICMDIALRSTSALVLWLLTVTEFQFVYRLSISS